MIIHTMKLEASRKATIMVVKAQPNLLEPTA
jgi:hypothetical protein